MNAARLITYSRIFPYNTVFRWQGKLLALMLLINGFANGQSNEEIIVSVNVQRIGLTEMPAIIHNEAVFLPVNLLFDFLKIKNKLSPGIDLNEGFFINAKASFIIDKNKNRILYKNEIFPLAPGDLIQSETNLYLKSDYFGTIFGLHCAYSSRDLSITISTTLELPAITELRQEQMRKNISKLKGESREDTLIKRSYPIFSLGNADWAINAIHETSGKSTANFNLDIGAALAGGEADLYLKYTANTPVQFQEQYYRWRYVNNDNPVIRQVTIGKIRAHSTSTIYAPITGIQITNTPATYRKSFGTYRLSDKTESGSIVELYVNNVLIDFTKADGSGFYTFDIPLVYGNSIIKLRFYGISGEDRSREQTISIPFTFIPLHDLEYSLTAGIVGDDDKSKFVRGVVNYGLTRHVTVGAGTEYLSTIKGRNAMPFLSVSIQAASNLLISGEYTAGVRSKGIINYRHCSNVELSINYTKYTKGQQAIKNYGLEERKAVLSMPFRGKYFKGLSRITLNQLVFPGYKNTNAELLISGVLYGISTHLTTYAQIYQGSKQFAKPVVYSSLSFAISLPKSLRITPQLHYSYDIQKISMLKCEVEKKIFRKGYLNVSYENNFANNNKYLSIGLRYNFSFAQTSLSTRQTSGRTSTTFSARGAVLYDKKTNTLAMGNQSVVGKAALIILPFLDINCNGWRDPNEPKVAGLRFHINGGHAARNKRDSSIHVVGLTAYTKYAIEFENDFDNIAWQIVKKRISVFTDPNHQTVIQIPIAVVGEVSGTVLINGVRNKTDAARFTIRFYNANATEVAHTLTETDGSFTFMGLAPGQYTARLDGEQLTAMKLVSSPVLSLTILPNPEGDTVSGLKFKLYSLPDSRVFDAIPVH